MAALPPAHRAGRRGGRAARAKAHDDGGRRKTMTVMTPPRNPYSGMLASYLADGFFGREREVADLVQGVTARVPSSFVISGIRTIGKTTLLRYLRDPRRALTRYAAYMAPKYHGAGADTLARALRFVYVDFH